MEGNVAHWYSFFISAVIMSYASAAAGLSVCPILVNTKSQETPGGNLTTSGTNVHLYSGMDLLDFVVKCQKCDNTKHFWP